MESDILPSNEFTTFEDRRYINPSLGVTATNSFVDNLRSTQKSNNQQIANQTQRLGTNVSSNLGGLLGGQGYWTSRYQTPQTNSAIADLRATAQAKALNDALANEKAMWDKRYQEAYRAYQSRQNDKQNAALAGDSGQTVGGVDYVDSTGDNIVNVDGVTPGVEGGYTVANIDTDAGNVLGYTGVPYGSNENYTWNLGDKQTTTVTTPKVFHRENGKNLWSWKLPSGQFVTPTSSSQKLVYDADGNYYLLDESKPSLSERYVYVGR